jgi:DNA-binding NarL/FixJ family response regulator
MSLFRVSWDREIEAPSAVEAAFLAYKQQKEQSTSTASYSVQSDSELFEDVTISQVAPLELLTLRECEVARLVMQGASNADIGKELSITTRTVKAHISHIFEKFHVTKRVNLATKMLRMQRSDTDAVI